MSLKGYFLRHFYIYVRESYPFLTVIVLIDLLPLIAVFWLGWSAMDAIYLYFLETLILLGFTFAKMWKANYIIALLNDKTKQLIGRKVKKESKWNLGIKIPKMTWAVKGVRGFIHMTFLMLNVPFVLFQILIISLISGHGFSLGGFMEHNIGKIDFGFIHINFLYLILFMFFVEHAITYSSKYLGEEEHENTGMINEAFNFSLRILIQQVVLIGLLAMIISLDAGKSTIIFLILFKTFMDVTSFVFNRIWGSLKGKMEGRTLFGKKKKSESDVLEISE